MKTTRTFFLRSLAVLLFAWAITSCGGGGGGSNAPVVVQEPIRFTSNFESGNIGTIKSLDATGLSWELALRDDNGNASLPDIFRTWWFVRADGVPTGKSCTWSSAAWVQWVRSWSECVRNRR